MWRSNNDLKNQIQVEFMSLATETVCSNTCRNHIWQLPLFHAYQVSKGGLSSFIRFMHISLRVHTQWYASTLKLATVRILHHRIWQTLQTRSFPFFLWVPVMKRMSPQQGIMHKFRLSWSHYPAWSLWKITAINSGNFLNI